MLDLVGLHEDRFTHDTAHMNHIILLRAYWMEALPGVWGNKGIYFRGTGEQRPNFEGNRGTGEQRQYWGTGNIENKFLILGEQGNKPVYFSGTREQVPHPTGRAYSNNKTHDSVLEASGSRNMQHHVLNCPCNLNPIKLHFYFSKIGVYRVYIIILFLL